MISVFFRAARVIFIFAVVATPAAWCQHVVDPHASVVDVGARQAQLKSTTDPLLLVAIKSLRSCAKLPFVPAPTGRMSIPSHYLSGSSGPVNPAEAPAVRVYEDFERRVAAGMSQYLATGSHEESARALAQLDAWAQAGALLDYSRSESQQAWFQIEWTLSSVGISHSVLVNDSTLDSAQLRRVTAWLLSACRKDLSFERTGDSNNNHHYWRALAATSIGVVAGDDTLFRFGLDTYRQAIGEIDSRGAFPKEMARHENAIHYQGFALQPLVVIAQFAARQGYDLYRYQMNGHTLRDAIVFFGRAIEDPGIIRPYTSDKQSRVTGGGDFASLAFYIARFGTDGMPQPIVEALKRPVSSDRIGPATLLAAP